MTNFLGILDSNDKRKMTYVKKIKDLISFVKGLKVDSISTEGFSLIWAAGDWTPIDSLADNDEVVLVFGDAIERASSKRVTAAKLHQLWSDPRFSEAFDGIHVAIMYNSKDGLVVGADLLGVFPVYYYFSQGVVLFGSSPELFRYHPCFEMEFDPEGLVGILLSKGLVNGRCLLENVRRLSSGHLLKFLDNQVFEVSQYSFPMSTKYFDYSISEQVEVLDIAFEEAISRHIQRDKNCCLMLSGGLDSTLLAGYLARGGYEVVLLTEGLKSDNEMRSAKKVAKSLGFKHISFQTVDSDYGKFSELHSTWQHVCGGFTGVGFWRFFKYLRGKAPYVITGFAGDSVFGTNVNRGLTNDKKRTSFDAFFSSINNDAFSPNVLGKLLKNDYSFLIPKVLNNLKKIYHSYPGVDFQQSWGFGLNQRTRFHDLNGVWSLSFGAWPILPFADHKLLEVVCGLPKESLVNRRVERELLRVKFPKLAKLNLAGDAINNLSVEQSFQNRLKEQIYGTSGLWGVDILRELRDLLFNRLMGERRYWLRQINFDSPEWIAVRKGAESDLYLTTEFFRKEALDDLMPSSDSKYYQVLLKMKVFGVNRTASLKIILGLTFWLKNHFNAVTNLKLSGTVH